MKVVKVGRKDKDEEKERRKRKREGNCTTERK